MRYALLIPALILDGLQAMFALIFLALQAITPVGAGAGAGIGAAAFCWKNSSGVIDGAINAVACGVGGAGVGAALSALATPIGMAIDVTLSIVVGGTLIMALAMSGMFYPGVILSAFMGEVVPFFNVLPFWTAMTWRCIQLKKKKEEAKGIKKAWSFVTAERGEDGLADQADQRTELKYGRRFVEPNQQYQPYVSETATPRTPPLLNKKFADIRPAAKGAALALLLFVGAYAHAQVVPDPVQYVVYPDTPGPHQVVKIEAQGVGSFLGEATITWTQDGKVIKTGVGERTLTFTTPALGTQTIIRVSIDSSQGDFSRTFTFSPSTVNIVWEADTTVPPLYRGKPLYSGGSSLRLVAFPTVYSGKARVAQSALSYQWSYKDEPLVNNSGLGRYMLDHAGDMLERSEDITLDVYYGAQKVAHADVSIPATDPMILLYQRDPLRGPIYESALPSGINLTGKELSILAEPYYFSTEAKRNGLLQYTWTLNDNETTGPDSSRGILTLRQAGAGQGDVQLGVRVQNNDSNQFVQAAESFLRIVFGQQSDSFLNFFGL
jgi:hypothetical protein